MLDSDVSVVELAAEVGEQVAGPVADEVDRDSRFPREAVAALRERGLLSALVPRRLGGYGAGLGEVAGAVRALARHCSASALVLAMHSIDLSNLVRQGVTEPLEDLQREVSQEQLLFANANSEVGIGGDVGRSNCALEVRNGSVELVKEALAISYGAHADVIAATARRSPESEATDQVQVLCRRFSLEPLSEWDAIGLRGTCSQGFRLTAEVEPELVYATPFVEIASSGGLQTNMVLLSSVWVGIAEAAAAKAHAYVRAAARRQIGSTPKSALRLAELSRDLDSIRALLDMSVQQVERFAGTPDLESLALLAGLRNLKVASSEGAVGIARGALEICGIAGYKRDTPFSLDRQLRDAHGGLVMVSNERYLQMNAEALIARKHL